MAPAEGLQKPRRAKRKRPPKSNSRKELESAYKAAWEQIPALCTCPKCGQIQPKEMMERHHPAGRRKASFCFTFQVCWDCHDWIHDHPADATLLGLLWPGRNSKVFTHEDAEKLVRLNPFPATYALDLI